MGRSQGGGAFTGTREWYSGGGGQRADIAAVQQSVAFLEQDDSGAADCGAVCGGCQWPACMPAA